MIIGCLLARAACRGASPATLTEVEFLTHKPKVSELAGSDVSHHDVIVHGLLEIERRTGTVVEVLQKACNTLTWSGS